jgi:hypothetical protein
VRKILHSGTWEGGGSRVSSVAEERAEEMLSDLRRFAVACNNCDFISAALSTHVKQLLLHGIGGEDYTVHSLTLAAMGSDGVAVVEVPIVAGSVRPSSS